MTTQEFLSQFSDGLFSEAVMQEIMDIIGSSTEITPELATQLAEVLEREIDEDLKDVEVDPVTLHELENKLETELKILEDDMSKTQETFDSNMSELVDMSKKVDVLERLHSQCFARNLLLFGLSCATLYPQ